MGSGRPPKYWPAGVLFALRARVASQLKSIVFELKIASVGYRPGSVPDVGDREKYYIDLLKRQAEPRALATCR